MNIQNSPYVEEFLLIFYLFYTTGASPVACASGRAVITATTKCTKDDVPNEKNGLTECCTASLQRRCHSINHVAVIWSPLNFVQSYSKNFKSSLIYGLHSLLYFFFKSFQYKFYTINSLFVNKKYFLKFRHFRFFILHFI